jgi:hypothetical protein
MMRGNIAPFVQFRQALKTGHVCRVGSRQIQLEPKPFVVFLQVLKVGVSVVKGAIGRKLLLYQDSKRGAHPLANDLR